jgi:putative PIN family toxin of toxin-antitoxin system
VRVVLDTNVLLAGVATHGLCEGLLAICLKDHSIVLSEHILDEFAKNYAKKFKASTQLTERIVATMRKFSELVIPAGVSPDACDDASDLPVLGTAVAGNVDCLVTGDRGLLALKEYRGIPIVSPRELYDIIRASG